MNSSKKILNQQNQGEDKKRNTSASVPAKKLKKGSISVTNIKPIILTAVCIVLLLVLCIGVGIQQFKPKVVITVGDTKISMNDMMYPIYEVESKYLPYDEMYQSYYGTSVWDADYQGSDTSVSGMTNSIGLKQDVLNSEVEYEILYQMAKKANYELTEDEKKKASEDAEKALKDLSWIQKMRLNISKSNLTDRFQKRALAERYRDDQKQILNKDVDEAAAIKDISKEDYRQYDIQYYYGSTSKNDDNGTAKEMSDDEKKALAAKIQEVAKKSKTEKDFTKLISEDEKDITFVKDGNFTKSDGWSYLSSENLKKIRKMKNGEISDAILDDSTGYYVVVKMINNNSNAAYQTACDDAISSAQDDAYQTWFDKQAENAKYTVNNDVWSEVTIGAVTTDIVTAEDLEKMKEDSSDTTKGSNE